MPGPARPPAPDRYDRAASPDATARRDAAQELAFDPSPNAVRMLLVLLERDVDPSVRASAAIAIDRRKDPDLDGALDAAAKRDPDASVRETAAAAHRRLWPWRKRPGRAAGLSLLCPGCGQLYLGDNTGALNVAATAGMLVSAVTLARGHTIALDGSADSAQVPIAISLVAA